MNTNEEIVKKRIEILEWIKRKFDLVNDSDIYGKMHNLEASANGYERYIVSFKCDDKQGEIARQSVEIDQLKKQIAAYREVIELALEDRREDSDIDYVGKLAEAKCNTSTGSEYVRLDDPVILEMAEALRQSECVFDELDSITWSDDSEFQGSSYDGVKELVENSLTAFNARKESAK